MGDSTLARLNAVGAVTASADARMAPDVAAVPARRANHYPNVSLSSCHRSGIVQAKRGTLADARRTASIFKDSDRIMNGVLRSAVDPLISHRNDAADIFPADRCSARQERERNFDYVTCVNHVTDRFELARCLNRDVQAGMGGGLWAAQLEPAKHTAQI